MKTRTSKRKSTKRPSGKKVKSKAQKSPAPRIRKPVQKNTKPSRKKISASSLSVKKQIDRKVKIVKKTNGFISAKNVRKSKRAKPAARPLRKPAQIAPRSLPVAERVRSKIRKQSLAPKANLVSRSSILKAVKPKNQKSPIGVKKAMKVKSPKLAGEESKAKYKKKSFDGPLWIMLEYFVLHFNCTNSQKIVEFYAKTCNEPLLALVLKKFVIKFKDFKNLKQTIEFRKFFNKLKISKGVIAAMRQVGANPNANIV